MPSKPGAALSRRRLQRAVALAVLALLSGWLGSVPAASPPEYVGAERCAACHAQETQRWRGSHHDMAMAEATGQTVLGDFSGAEFTAHGVTSRFYRKDDRFFVRTDGPDGKLHDYAIRYTFGWYPLQQYLVEFPKGRLQSLGIAWDTRPAQEGGQRWFHLYPQETMDHTHPLHWTGREQTWNYQCAECHSTNLHKGYDPASDSYQTTWSEIDVACEACHGPGSKHVAWAGTVASGAAAEDDASKGLVVDLADRDGSTWSTDPQSGKPRRSQPRSSHTEIELCARCHSRRGQIWDHYEYGKPLYNTHRLALLDQQLYFPDGQIKDEVYVYGSFIQSRMYAAGVTCHDCHEPHSLKLRAAGNSLCTRCHLPARYDVERHHHHPQGSPGSACPACHMPQRTYMVIDARADHSLRVPRPDLSDKLGTPNACNNCHADKPAVWAAKAVEGWYPVSQHRGPHFGEVLQAARRNSPQAARRLLALASDAKQPGIARATAVDELREHPGSDQLSTVEHLLTDDDALVRGAAVRWLELTDLRTRVDQGWTLLEDQARTVRLDAARVLAPVSRQHLPDKFRTQLDTALQEYTTAQNVNAERPEAHLNLGLLAVAEDKPLEAEQDYQAAIRLDKTFTPAYANLADLYRQYQRDADGEQVLRQGIAAIPDDASLYYALGLLQVREQRMSEAAKALQHAVELAPASTQYRYVYALALQREGQVSEAVSELEAVVRRDAANRDARMALIGMYREQGNANMARLHLNQLHTQYPDDAAVDALWQEMNP
jgi:tetratricopeptide (TPR) repeat protein